MNWEIGIDIYIPLILCIKQVGFPGGASGKESASNAGDLGSIPGSGRSPGEGHGNPLPHSCLENPMDSGAWCASPQGHKELDMIEVTQYACTYKTGNQQEPAVQQREFYSMLYGDLNGKEIQKRGDICKQIADSLCHTAETNTTL